jgi:hypothetical protein
MRLTCVLFNLREDSDFYRASPATSLTAKVLDIDETLLEDDAFQDEDEEGYVRTI